MPILNYTTQISSEKTASEIQKKLATAKAKAVLSEYDENGIMCAMSFRIVKKTGEISFRLPANIDSIYSILCKNTKIPKKLKTKEQAARVTWRILKNWIEAQLAMVEAEMTDIQEVFLAYSQNKSGDTLYEVIKNDGFKLISK